MSEEIKKWKLRRKRNRLRKLYANELAAAKTSEEKYDVGSKMQHELNEFEDVIDYINSAQLIRAAVHLDVPIPRDEEFWYRSNWTGEKFLMTTGRSRLREAIRNEKKQRRDVWRDVFITVSTLISVISLVRSCRK